MRIGPIMIQRARSRTGEQAERDVAYSPPMAEEDGFWATMELPKGARYIPALVPAGPIDPAVAAWVQEHLVLPRTEAVEASVARMREVAGSISIGRPPRKSDYRARWRYNGEDFGDEG